MITRNFNLYLNAGHSVPLVINVNQYDSGEQWVFTLYNADGTQYTPSSGSIIGIKADGYVIANAGTVDENGRVVITETEQMTAAAGKAVFELQLDNNTHGTANFIVLVETDPSDGGEVSGSDISLLRQALDGGLSQTAVNALLACFQNVAWVNDDGQTYYDALEDALNAVRVITLNTNTLSFSTIGSTQQLTATTVPEGGTVTWESSNTSVATVSSSGLVTTTGYGTATITASSGDVSATCSVSVVQATLVSISAVYTQSGTVYDTDSLDSLKTDLVVTATYDNQTTETVPSADYTLSGTLTAGTSTITVTYGGKTATFNVTVSGIPEYGTFTPQNVVNGSYISDTGEIGASAYGSYSEDYLQTFSKVYSFTFAGLYSADPNYRICEYDESKNYIRQNHITNTGSTYGLSGASQTLSLLENTKYVRLSWYGNDQVRLPTVTMDTASYTDLPMEIGDIDSSTGADTTGPKRCRTKSYIPINSSSLTVKDCPFYGSWYGWHNSSGYFCRCYDSSYNLVGSTTWASADTTNVALPTGTAYIRLVIQKNSNNFPTDFANSVMRPIVINGVNYRIVEA